MDKLTALDRTLFEYLRTALVGDGRLPDSSAYATQAEYDAALLLIPDPIHIQGVGVGYNRDAKQSQSVVLSRGTMDKGKIGGSNVKKFVEQPDGTFQKLSSPTHTKSIMYTVRQIAGNVATERYLTSLMYRLFEDTIYLKLYDYEQDVFTDEDFHVVNGGERDVSSTDYSEKIHTLFVSDVWLSEGKIEHGRIVPMTSVTFNAGTLSTKEQPKTVAETDSSIVID